MFISDRRFSGRLRVSFRASSLCIAPGLLQVLIAVPYNAVLHTVLLLIQTLHSSQADQRCVYVFALRKRRLFGRQELRMGKVYTDLFTGLLVDFFYLAFAMCSCSRLATALYPQTSRFKMAPSFFQLAFRLWTG